MYARQLLTRSGGKHIKLIHYAIFGFDIPPHPNCLNQLTACPKCALPETNLLHGIWSCPSTMQFRAQVVIRLANEMVTHGYVPSVNQRYFVFNTWHCGSDWAEYQMWMVFRALSYNHPFTSHTSGCTAVCVYDASLTIFSSVTFPDSCLW